MDFNFETLREQLVCPKSHAALVHEADALVSCDPASRLAYPIRDGIPIMLVDEAREIAAEEWSEIMGRHGRDPATGEQAAI